MQRGQLGVRLTGPYVQGPFPHTRAAERAIGGNLRTHNPEVAGSSRCPALRAAAASKRADLGLVALEREDSGQHEQADRQEDESPREDLSPLEGLL